MIFIDSLHLLVYSYNMSVNVFYSILCSTFYIHIILNINFKNLYLLYKIINIIIIGSRYYRV